MCDAGDIWYGVATISRMLKNIGLFCKRALQKRPVFCKETCIFKHPTHRSHPICTYVHTYMCTYMLHIHAYIYTHIYIHTYTDTYTYHVHRPRHDIAPEGVHTNVCRVSKSVTFSAAWYSKYPLTPYNIYPLAPYNKYLLTPYNMYLLTPYNTYLLTPYKISSHTLQYISSHTLHTWVRTMCHVSCCMVSSVFAHSL